MEFRAPVAVATVATVATVALSLVAGCDASSPAPPRAPALEMQMIGALPPPAPMPAPPPTQPPLASLPAGRCPISTATWTPPVAKATATPAASASAPPGHAPAAGSATPVAPRVTRASEVVAGAAAAFRRCYNRLLRVDPDAAGTVRVTAKIDAAGCVSATAATSQRIDATTVACVVDRVRQMEFEAPEGGGAIVVIPVTFVTEPSPPHPPPPPLPPPSLPP